MQLASTQLIQELSAAFTRRKPVTWSAHRGIASRAFLADGDPAFAARVI